MVPVVSPLSESMSGRADLGTKPYTKALQDPLINR